MNCRIPLDEIRPGDPVLFKREGPISFVLGNILMLLEPKWSGWHWHAAFVTHLSPDKGWMICEALAGGITLNPLNKYDTRKVRVYRWFDIQPSQDQIAKWVSGHYGAPYDVFNYLWTMIQRGAEYLFGRTLPRMLDKTYTCHEALCEFAEDMGKPITDRCTAPLITDITRAFGDM